LENSFEVSAVDTLSGVGNVDINLAFRLSPYLNGDTSFAFH
jgi:hypothetical protein